MAAARGTANRGGTVNVISLGVTPGSPAPDAPTPPNTATY
jgi:hypothetical protein